jgi:hypothetical protein
VGGDEVVKGGVGDGFFFGLVELDDLWFEQAVRVGLYSFFQFDAGEQRGSMLKNIVSGHLPAG